MNFLEEKIVKDGIVKEGNVLKVDSFLNHQMDIDLFNKMGEEWKKRFEGKNINKILTIEASGIGIACIVGETYICACMAARRASGMCSTSSDLLNTPCTPVATIPARMAGLSSIVRTTMRNAG